MKRTIISLAALFAASTSAVQVDAPMNIEINIDMGGQEEPDQDLFEEFEDEFEEDEDSVVAL